MNHPALFRPPTDRCPSDFRLDQRDAHELPPELAAGIDTHLHSCSDCQTRLSLRKKERQEFVVDLALLTRLSKTPDDRIVATPTRSFRRWLVSGGAIAATLLLGVFLGHLPDNTASPPHIKGSAHAGFFVSSAGEVHEVLERALVKPGDAIQVAVSSPTPVHVAVLSMDGAGKVEAYVANAGLTVVIPSGSKIPLPNSTVLDAILGLETVAVFLCENATAVQEMYATIKKGIPPAGCGVERFYLEKVGP